MSPSKKVASLGFSLLLSCIIFFSSTNIHAAEDSVAEIFDIDGNGEHTALTDGLLVVRYLFGFRGNSLITQALGSGASRTTAESIEAYLNNNIAGLDIDGNSDTKPLSDGLLLIRYLFGFEGDALINQAVATNATRVSAADIESFITTDSIFEYPNLFKDYETFKGISEIKNIVASLNIAVADQISLQTAVGASSLTFGFTEAYLNIIDLFPQLSRDLSCEEGSLTINSYGDSVPSSFIMSNFSGVETVFDGEESDCRNDIYLDGAINYSINPSDDNTTVSVDFGTPASQVGDPFGTYYFVGQDRNFNNSRAHLGSLYSNRIDSDSGPDSTIYEVDNALELFRVETNVAIDDFTKTAEFEKKDWILYKNLNITDLRSNVSRSFDATYERHWNQFGVTFKLLTEIKDVKADANGNITSGTADFNLTVLDEEENRFVIANVIFGDVVKITYNKEGTIKSN